MTIGFTQSQLSLVHDTQDNRIAECLQDKVAGTSSLIREYILAEDRLVGVWENGAYYAVRTDHIGRPIFATDSAANVVWEASYLPFGGVQASVGPNSNLRFPGQWFQAEAGLHQNWMRDYDPTLGRYLQTDPLGLVDGPSIYGYALQNPGRYTDPRGLQSSAVRRDRRGQGPTSAFGVSLAMAEDWLFGTGPDHREFGPDSPMTMGLQQVAAVSQARESFYNKNAGRCSCEEIEPVTDYRSPFGAKGYVDATLEGNAAWHFVGSFTIAIYPVENCKKLRFVLWNNSSFTSFAYGVAPSWDRSSFGPAGNMTQTYEWTEPFNINGCCLE